MGEPISIVLIEDNPLLREGIATLIRAEPGFKVLAASADIVRALMEIRTARPQVVLLDFGLEDDDSLRVTATIHEEIPLTKVIVMGLLPVQDDIAEFVRAGAAGFIMKDASFDQFLETIRTVAAGGKVLPPSLTTTLFSQITSRTTQAKRAVIEAVRLTGRERQVIDLISEGLSNKEIATRLNLATYTVKGHVHNVLEKLALHSRLEIAAFNR